MCTYTIKLLFFFTHQSPLTPSRISRHFLLHWKAFVIVFQVNIVWTSLLISIVVAYTNQWKLKSNNIQYLDTEIYKLYHDRLRCCCMPYWWWLQCAIEIGQVLDGGGFHLHFTALFDENCASLAQLPIDRSSLRHVVNVFLRFSQWGFPEIPSLISPSTISVTISSVPFLISSCIPPAHHHHTRAERWLHAVNKLVSDRSIHSDKQVYRVRPKECYLLKTSLSIFVVVYRGAFVRSSSEGIGSVSLGAVQVVC